MKSFLHWQGGKALPAYNALCQICFLVLLSTHVVVRENGAVNHTALDGLCTFRVEKRGNV